MLEITKGQTKLPIDYLFLNKLYDVQNSFYFHPNIICFFKAGWNSHVKYSSVFVFSEHARFIYFQSSFHYTESIN
jgi:hypothetical protein